MQVFVAPCTETSGNLPVVKRGTRSRKQNGFPGSLCLFCLPYMTFQMLTGKTNKPNTLMHPELTVIWFSFLIIITENQMLQKLLLLLI